MYKGGDRVGKSNIKKLLFILVVIVGIVSAAVVVYKKDSIMTMVIEPGKKDEEVSFFGQKVQQGFLVADKDYIYFTEPADGNKIYKAKLDGSSKSKLSDDSAEVLVLAGDWLFYSNTAEDKKVYRINVDGSGRQQISEHYVNFLTVGAEGVYYSNVKDGNKLYRTDFEGKEAVKLNDEGSAFINLTEDYIVYRNGAQKVVRIDLDGSNRKVLEEEKVSFVRVDADNKVFCGIQSEDRNIYSMTIDGEDKKKLMDSGAFDAEITDDWVYFSNEDSENHNVYIGYLYRIKKNGKVIERISLEAAEKFSIVGDKIFYMAPWQGNKIYKIELDGSKRQALEGKTIANSVEEICNALRDEIKFDITIEQTKELYKKAVDIVASATTADMDDLEKELAIHDYLVTNVRYDHEVIEAYNNNIVTNLESHGIYNALMEGKAVCDGFAWTAKLMLAIAGVDSELVTGWGIPQTEKAEEKLIYHAWNLVKVDGKYHHLDVTWDENIYEETGMMSYMYFNLSGNEMGQDHKWDKSYYEKATSTNYNFFKGLYLAARDGSTIYYINPEDNFTLYKINIDGSEDTKLGDDPCNSIEIKDGHVEYTCGNEKKKYKIN
jgi:hypothetical protein